MNERLEGWCRWQNVTPTPRRICSVGIARQRLDVVNTIVFLQLTSYIHRESDVSEGRIEPLGNL